MRRTRATFSSPKRYISGFPFDGDARRADLLEQVGIALFDDEAPLDAAANRRDLLQRQRPRKAQFQHAGLGVRLADVHGTSRRR